MTAGVLLDTGRFTCENEAGRTVLEHRYPALGTVLSALSEGGHP